MISNPTIAPIQGSKRTDKNLKPGSFNAFRVFFCSSDLGLMAFWLPSFIALWMPDGLSLLNFR